jgi:hypothetical protein
MTYNAAIQIKNFHTPWGESIYNIHAMNAYLAIAEESEILLIPFNVTEIKLTSFLRHYHNNETADIVCWDGNKSLL